MNLENPIAKGNTADIYLRDGKIIKLFKDFLPNAEAEYEAAKQRYAYSCGLSVPQIFEVTNINGKQALVMEFIKGRAIGHLLYDNMAKAEQYMSVSVDIQLKIHEIVAENFEAMTGRLERRIKAAPPLGDRKKNALIERLHGMPCNNRLCHGDFHVLNLIQRESDGGVTIIDWVDSSAGDIKADVYRSYLLYSGISKDLAEMYLRLYCEKSGLRQEEIFIWEPIIAGARLSENISAEERGRLIAIVERYDPVSV